MSEMKTNIQIRLKDGETYWFEIKVEEIIRQLDDCYLGLRSFIKVSLEEETILINSHNITSVIIKGEGHDKVIL